MLISDWSSDVCSSDLPALRPFVDLEDQVHALLRQFDDLRRDGGRDAARTTIEFDDPADVGLGLGAGDRKRVVSGKGVSVRVESGGRRIIKQKRHYIYRCKSRKRKQVKRIAGAK